VVFGSDDYNAAQAFVAVGLGVAAASFRSSATASMLEVPRTTATAFAASALP
jgi:hypothetical protein